MLTSLLAHTTALHCVWFLPFHTRGGSDRSPGAGHRSGRLSQGALPVSGMPWGPVWGLLCQPSIYHFVQSTHVRRAMRSFVTSVSGSRSSPDPVRLCAQYASSTHHVSDSATFLRSTISPTFTPSPADVRCKISAYHRCRHRDLLDRQSTSSSRRQPRPPCGRWTCSQHAAKGLILESCEASQASEASILVIGHRQPVSPHPPPTTSTALIGSLGGLLC
jgi:hypothetical protein